MKRVLRENGLSLVLFAIFVLLVIGMSIAGWLDHNSDLQDEGQAQLGYFRYLVSAHFAEGLFENWESEFLQMGAYVYLTVFLRQRGSAESKGFPEEQDSDDEKESHQWDKVSQNPADPSYHKIPTAVKRGGWKLKIYQNSLTLAFVGLFLFSLFGHAAGGAREYNREEALHGKPPVSTAEYFVTSRFWYESFQNWQSEFLAVFAIVVLSIWLRQEGSPESKEVAAPHHKTGK